MTIRLEQEVLPPQESPSEEGAPSQFSIAYDPELFERFFRHLWLKGNTFIVYDAATQTYSIPHFDLSPPQDKQQAVKITDQALASEFQEMLQNEAAKMAKSAAEQARLAAEEKNAPKPRQHKTKQIVLK